MTVDLINVLTQFLTFKLEDETYALDIARVHSVLDFEKVTKVPKTPDFMRGVINLRGSVVPIVDLKLKFGMSITEKTIDTCVIIVEVMLDNEATVLGLLADSVQEVIDLEPDEIEPPPQIGTRLRTEFITGMGKKDDDFIIILDLNKIFTLEELTVVHETRASITSSEENVSQKKQTVNSDAGTKKRTEKRKKEVTIDA